MRPAAINIDKIYIIESIFIIHLTIPPVLTDLTKKVNKEKVTKKKLTKKVLSYVRLFYAESIGQDKGQDKF